MTIVQGDYASHQPQPEHELVYSYYQFPEVEKRFLSPFDNGVLVPGALCWVLRGRRQGGNKKTKDEKRNKGTTENARKALFNRAWVVDPQPQQPQEQEEDRVLLRYPLGSTYHVKRSNLLPVLTQQYHRNLVIVLQDTLMYRRWAVVHTQPSDSFCEIGCDIGILVNRVSSNSDVPQHIWGLDTDPKRILEARKRYPECQFVHWKVPLDSTTGNSSSSSSSSSDNRSEETPSRQDVSEEDELSNNIQQTLPQEQQQQQEEKRRNLLPMNLFPNPRKDDNANDLVVAIDINGNRELKAVRQCIQIVIQEWKPRLIIVKSTTLYEELETTRRNEL